MIPDVAFVENLLEPTWEVKVERVESGESAGASYLYEVWRETTVPPAMHHINRKEKQVIMWFTYHHLFTHLE